MNDSTLNDLFSDNVEIIPVNNRFYDNDKLAFMTAKPDWEYGVQIRKYYSTVFNCISNVVSSLYYSTKNISTDFDDYIDNSEEWTRLFVSYFPNNIRKAYINTELKEIIIYHINRGKTPSVAGVTMFYYNDTTLQRFEELIHKYEISGDAGEGFSFKLITHTSYGIGSTAITVDKLTVDLQKNYNDSLCELHETCLNFFNFDTSNGKLMLFHGEPGTGKTYYLRYLLQLTQNENVYFIPPQLFNKLDDPSFTDFLLKNKNAVIIIEDAEQLIKSRNNSNSPVSSLLQFTDGFLGDCYNFRFILTFNAPPTDIDPALLRDGRLYLEYEFDKLSKIKTKEKFKDLGVDINDPEPKSLAEIYNHYHDTNRTKTARKVIGFS